MRKRLIIAALFFAFAGAFAGAAFMFRVAIREAVAARLKPVLPPPQPYRPVASATPTEPVPPPKATASNVKRQTSNVIHEVNLAVPFTSQAPYANWELPYQEACEEASLIMLDAFMKGETSLARDEADRRILALVEWQKTRFGYYEDTTAEETAAIAREYYGYAEARALPLKALSDALAQVEKGNAVIVPAAGRLLKNPYFRGQGPLYHMLVIKGVTKDGKIITNDPGTRRGADFLYDPETLWNAIHDWNGGDVAHGAKLMIAVGK
jgi:hypothetical protein